jgi:hypothetical protein
MKYNDNGTIKEIKVKAFDTLPVGAIVEYNGSTIPSGWTDIGNNQIQKTSQYIEGGASLSNTYGTSNENGYTQEYINGIIESGSNENGYYIKYADGTMICYNTNYFSVKNWNTVTYPIAFTSIPNIICNVNTGTVESSTLVLSKVSNIGLSTFHACIILTSGYDNGTINWIAIGKWK